MYFINLPIIPDLHLYMGINVGFVTCS